MSKFRPQANAGQTLNKHPRYSVIIPAFNAARTVAQCLDALAAQSIAHDTFEVIVVDDGSVDATAKIISDYPFRYIRQPNAGPASARNHGAREASGEIILFTDADCAPAPDWIAQMTRPFDEPDVMAVKGAYRTHQHSLTARFAQVEFEERFELLKRAPSIDMVDTYSAAFRREAFWSAGGFDTNFPVANNEDTELSYKLSAAGHKMVFNPDAVVYHMKHPASPAIYARQKFWRGYWRMVVYKRFPRKMIRDTYTPKTLKAQVVLSVLLLPLIILGLIVPKVAPLTGACALMFMGSTIPFMLFAARRDIAVCLLSPLFLCLRAMVIGAGVAYFAITGAKT